MLEIFLRHSVLVTYHTAPPLKKINFIEIWS